MLPRQEQPNKHSSNFIICQRAAIPRLKGVMLELHLIRFPVTAVFTNSSNVLVSPSSLLLPTLNGAAKDLGVGRRENGGRETL